MLYYYKYISTTLIMVLKLCICEIFHPKIHGYDNNSTKGVNTHYMVRYSIDTVEFMNKCDFEELQDDISMLKETYNFVAQKLDSESCLIRNHKNILSHPQYPQVDIVDVIRLEPGQEDVAIIKTCWLRIFQRKWRSYYKYKQALTMHCKRISSIQHREIHGKWPPFHYKKED